MRIRKRFPSFPIVPSSVASSTEAPSQQEEMDVSSFPVPAERTARETSLDHALTDWKDIIAQAQKLLGGSSHGANYCTVQPCVQEEHSRTGPVVNEEAVTELQAGNERSKNLLEQANPNKTVVIKQGGGFSNSQKKRKYSGTGISNWKGTTVSREVEMFPGNSKYGKTETAVRIDYHKERIEARPSTEVGFSRRACVNGSSGKKHKNEDEDKNKEEEGYSSGSPTESTVKMRSLKSVYADIRSLHGFSKVNYNQDITDGKSLDEE